MNEGIRKAKIGFKHKHIKKETTFIILVIMRHKGTVAQTTLEEVRPITSETEVEGFSFHSVTVCVEKWL